MMLILGILCGNCERDETVSVLLNRCTSCGERNIILIPILSSHGINSFLVNMITKSHFLVILVMIIVGTIVLLDRPLPQWTYPLLFYVQVCPLLSFFFLQIYYLLITDSPNSFISFSLVFPYSWKICKLHKLLHIKFSC